MSTTVFMFCLDASILSSGFRVALQESMTATREIEVRAISIRRFVGVRNKYGIWPDLVH